MKVSCSRNELHDALRLVSGVVDPRSIKPILQDVRLRADEEGIEISATDLEVGIKYRVRDAEVEEPGSIVIPTDRVGGIVSESRVERISLEAKDDRLLIRASGSRFHVMGVPADEFPEIPDFPEGKSLEMEGAVLREMIEKTIFAVALEKQRYALNGVLMVTKEGSTKVTMVGTDGRRLALVRRKANVASPFTAEAIVPAKALQEIQKMVGSEEIAKVNIQERQIFLRGENGVLVAQLVEGRFPPYDDVIPSDCDKKLEVKSDEFAKGIRQAAVLSRRDSRAVRLGMSDKLLVIESSDPEAGDAYVEVEATYEGTPVEMRFNPDFLLDGIKAIDQESIRLEMKDNVQAAVMRAGADYQYLIMPITQD